MKTKSQIRAMLAQDEVDEWNAKYPIGTAVIVTKDNGVQVHTKTRSEASVLSGHTAVIWLEGLSGCYALDRCEPVVSNG